MKQLKSYNASYAQIVPFGYTDNMQFFVWQRYTEPLLDNYVIG